MARNKETGLTIGGKRADTYSGPTLDDLAKARGYDSFAQAESESPQMAALIKQENPGVEGDGIIQVAERDDLHPAMEFLRYAAPIIATANIAGVHLPGLLGGGGGGAATPMPGAAGATGGTTAAAGAGTGTTLATAGSGGTLSRILSTIGQASQLAGPAVSRATQAEYNNTDVANDASMERAKLERQDANYDLNAYNSNTNAANTFENMFTNRADLEQKQRDASRSASYRDSYAQNLPVSPNNPRPMTLSTGYKNTLATQANTPVTFGANTRPLPSHVPYMPRTLTIPEQQQPGRGAQTGNWVAPILTTLGNFGRPRPTQPTPFDLPQSDNGVLY